MEAEDDWRAKGNKLHLHSHPASSARASRTLWIIRIGIQALHVPRVRGMRDCLASYRQNSAADQGRDRGDLRPTWRQNIATPPEEAETTTIG